MIVIFGAITMDLLMTVPELPKAGRTALSPAYHLRPGGKGANQAIAVQRSGVKPKIYGRVGQDEFGNKLLENLQLNGIAINDIQTGPQPTALQHVSIDRHGDHIVTCATGANWSVRAAQVPDDVLTPGVWLLCSLDVPPDEVWSLIRRAKSRGCRIALNFDPAADTLPPDLLPLVDLLICNYEEARKLGTMFSFSSHDAIELARDLVQMTGGEVIVTLGRRGAVAATYQGAWQFPAFPVDVVDSTGTGDAFCGILVVALSQNLSIIEGISRAMVGSGLACLAFGAQDGIPKASTIDSWVNDLAPPSRI